MPCARTHSRRTRCESATTGVGAGAAWSTKTATFVVSHTRSLPRSRRPAMTASMTESCTMTRETGTMTRSPAFASRVATRDRIFSAMVLGNDPLTKQGIELIHRQRAGVGQGLDPPRDLAQLVLAEFEAKLLRAMVDRVLSLQAVVDVDRSLAPASRMAYRFALSRPLKLWPANSIAQCTWGRSATCSAYHCRGVAMRPVCATPTRFTHIRPTGV